MPRITHAPFWLASLAYAYAAYALSTLFVTTALRCIAAVILAGAGYMLVLLPIVTVWQPSATHAATIYACGIVFATMGGAWIAQLVFPRPIRQIGMLACVGLGTLFPVLIAAASDPAAPVRSMQYLYIAATAIGGGIAMGVLSSRSASSAI